jgi:hypothetical protein
MKAVIRRALLIAAFVLAGSASSGAIATDDNHDIIVLSNRADLISGGDALVDVVVPPGILRAMHSGKNIKIRGFINGEPLPADTFALRPNGRVQGLVQGLKVGENVLRVQTPGKSTEIVISNHLLQGPVFAGPQVQPWICNNDRFGLGPAQDEQCSTSTIYQFFYKPLGGGGFKPYDSSNPPGDVAQTTTDTGVTVPYIVRRERGVIDRAVYDIAVLFDPAQPWEPWAPQKGWNGKVFWRYAGDWNPNHLQYSISDVLNDVAVSRGFAVATSALNIGGDNGNDVVSAEATMMVKEHFIEVYGPVRYTLSDGGSGGSMMQHYIVSNYPGLLDGIMPTVSFPDVWQTVVEASDCGLLLRYYRQTSPRLWGDPNQQRAVNGHHLDVCSQWIDSFGFDTTWLQPDKAFGCLGGSSNTPESKGPAPVWVYNPVTNPVGVRCTLPDYQVAIFGTREQDGFANRPLDNVGVQYGLGALQAGAISAEQFVDLNEKIGGRDINFRWQPQRTVTDTAAVEIGYRTGRTTYPREAAKVPILDMRGVPCDIDGNNIHTCVHTWSMRARLIEANGYADNQVVLYGAPSAYAFDLLDRWVAAIKADASDTALEEKVLLHKPADAVNACWQSGQRITDWSQCEALNPHYAIPRIVAGSPLADNIIKCVLKPISRSDYGVTLTDSQWARLQAAFPTGVCDWSKKPDGWQPSVPWLTYEDGPGGRELGPPPNSSHQYEDN